MAEERSLTFIAFDFGTKKMGVAVGQTITMTANPINCLSVNKGLPDWSRISALIDEWHPAGFIVGIPLNMDSSSQSVTFKAKRFAKELNNQFNLPVHEIDERLTTLEARQQLFELGGYKALKQISVDSFAAKLMLEAWMRSNIKDRKE
ncbi:MAG: Holliday junction resolvase RuvX [Gammaproteobacteria bacterium]|nr:Holliday junction resolvase RuvX [Gammaproteobacteria bacterium]